MCKYCDNEDSYELISKEIKNTIMGIDIGVDLLVYVSGGILYVANGGGTIDADFEGIAKRKIKYCPMCGRKLNE